MREGRGVLVSPDSSREVSQLLEVCRHPVAVAEKGGVAARIGVVIVQGRVAWWTKWSRVELLRTPSHVTRDGTGRRIKCAGTHGGNAVVRKRLVRGSARHGFAAQLQKQNAADELISHKHVAQLV
jgi:hypothetical protein